MQTLSREEAQYCADTFSNYFDQFTRIDEYMRDQKMAQIDSIPQSLPGMGFDVDMFDEGNISACVVQIIDSVSPVKQLEPSGTGRARETDAADLNNCKITNLKASQIFPRNSSQKL